MLDILAEKPLASFGFIGANTISNGEREGETNTQRFSIYTKLIMKFLSKTSFSNIE